MGRHQGLYVIFTIFISLRFVSSLPSLQSLPILPDTTESLIAPNSAKVAPKLAAHPQLADLQTQTTDTAKDGSSGLMWVGIGAALGVCAIAMIAFAARHWWATPYWKGAPAGSMKLARGSDHQPAPAKQPVSRDGSHFLVTANM